MAKANDTAMEELILRFKTIRFQPGIATAIHLAQEQLKKERQQIDSAFYAGKTNNYDGPSHYYFMEYIDND